MNDDLILQKFVKALGMLVSLKDHKDAYGRTAEYLELQPKAWDEAQKLLHEFHGSALSGDLGEGDKGVASDNNSNQASVASHSCTVGNSVEQDEFHFVRAEALRQYNQKYSNNAMSWHFWKFAFHAGYEFRKTQK